jgi:hypothetical protein
MQTDFEGSNNMPTAMSSNGPGQVTYEPIAITGMGCRFPGGVTDPRSFWTLLMNGKDAIAEVPPDRWSVDKFCDSDPTWPGRAVTKKEKVVKKEKTLQSSESDLALKLMRRAKNKAP